MTLEKYKASLNVSQVDSLLAGVNILVNIQEIPVEEIEAWLAAKDGEIDKIVADINIICESVKSQKSVMTAAITSPKSAAKATSPQTTPTPPPKPQDNAAKTTKNVHTRYQCHIRATRGQTQPL